MPLVNIIILTHNEFRFIGTCLRRLLTGSYKNIHIYLVDNNSSKEEYQKFYLKFKHNPKLTFIRSKKNLGFAGGNNLALSKINRGYIVFLNDDTFVTKHWLKPIISYMEAHSEVGACQPKIKDYRKKEYFEYAGAGGGFMDVYGFPFCRGRIFFTMEKDRGQYDDRINVVWCSGNCMVTRASIIKKVGKFDEIFFIYGEESDLCWRMHFAGYRLVYIPESVVYHYGSGTMQKQLFRKIYLHHRNGLILLLKNYTAGELIKYFPIRVVLDGIAFFYYLFYDRIVENAYAVIAAYISLINELPSIIKRRKKASFRHNKELYPYPLYNGSVVVDYFLRNKKKYSRL